MRDEVHMWPMEVRKDVEFNMMQTFSKLKSGLALIRS
jgi:hypothetical protein